MSLEKQIVTAKLQGEGDILGCLWTTTLKRHKAANDKSEQLPNNYPSFIRIVVRNYASMARVVVGVVVDQKE